MDIEKYAHQIFGVNLNDIPGFGRDAMLNFIAEVGERIKNFNSAKAFSKWLGFTPNNKASGGKIFSKRTLKISHPYPILLEWWLIPSETLENLIRLLTFSNGLLIVPAV